ncbi:MAG: hypothetical protein GY791_11235 [Alphaproteobacteria bacterium]|nr:hypothetical protein [Alphaproteobacteria bacterium]
MKRCDLVRQRLAEDGAAIAEMDIEIRHHLETCHDCTRFAAELKRLEAELNDLSCPDAPDELVAATLEAVRRTAGAESDTTWSGGRGRYVAGGLAAAVVIAASVALTLNIMESTAPYRAADREYADAGGGLGASEEQVATGLYRPQPPAESQSAAEPPRSDLEIAGAIDESSRVTGQRENVAGSENEEFEIAELAGNEGLFGDLRSRAAGQSLLAESEIIAQLKNQRRDADSSDDFAKENRRGGGEKDVVATLERGLVPETSAPVGKAKGDRRYHGAPAAPPAQASKQESRSASEFGSELYDTPGDDVFAAGAGSVTGPADEKKAATKSLDKGRAENVPDADPVIAGDAGVAGGLSGNANAPLGGLVQSEENKRRAVDILSTSDRTRQPADDFLTSYRALDGLTFQEPTGYWANTYIPGDPEMRLLQARLAAWNRAALGSDVRLEQAVHPIEQPFDAPRDAALAVYLDADTAAIEGETRLRIQVGLKGAERQGGHRPAMNIGVVLDLLSGADGDMATRIRALMTALERMDQPGDRFSLTVAGPSGGRLIAPDQFKHGPLQITLDRLFDSDAAGGGQNVELLDAVARAADGVRQGDDPNAILGSSLVLLVTGDSLDDDIDMLERLAHRNAIGGVPLSVVSLGTQAELANIDRLVAAGQGSRRILASPAEAMALVDRELHAASGAVARAVRLRIRLAAGVRLIDVLGSRPLGEPHAERVREAEQAIDQRLARNLGIEADRGDDEEGIQIVIPNFFAGDSHVVLLDVVADGPGPVAEVTVRYKDVIGLRNGITRASLAIGGGQRADGLLERNVLKNLVAWEIARGLRETGRDLGDLPRAIARLADLRDLVAGLRLAVVGWSGDPDLAADEAMLGTYLAVLGSSAMADTVHRHHLAESLRYAAFRKLQVAAR